MAWSWTKPRITLRQADLVRGGAAPYHEAFPEESVHAACRILAAHGRLCVHGFDAPKDRRSNRAPIRARPEPKAKGPSALSEAPGEGERPELIDSSWRLSSTTVARRHGSCRRGVCVAWAVCRR